MALPTVVKSWQFTVNQLVGAQGGSMQLNCAHALRAIKNILKAFGSNPWVVTASCAKVGGSTWTANNAGVDLWNNLNEIVWDYSSNPHAWIVLKQDKIGTGWSVCFDCYYWGGQECFLRVVIFPTGWTTPGTTTSRPSGPGEYQINAENAAWGPSGTNNQSGKVHVLQSTDGECTRVIYCRDGYASGFWAFDKARDPTAAWTLPGVATFRGATSGENIATFYWFNGNTYAHTRVGSIYSSVYLTGGGYAYDAAPIKFQNPDENSNEYPMFPIGLFCATTPVRGRKGSLYDLWWGSPQITMAGVCFPNDASRQFAQFGHIIVPWNGTQPQVA